MSEVSKQFLVRGELSSWWMVVGSDPCERVADALRSENSENSEKPENVKLFVKIDLIGPHGHPQLSSSYVGPSTHEGTIHARRDKSS